MGTPDFAVGSLQALCESGKHEILAVVTQPDRPKGRGNKLLQTPVKEYALEQGLTVYQPQKVKTPEFVELLHELQPELIVVAAFGQFFEQGNFWSCRNTAASTYTLRCCRSIAVRRRFSMPSSRAKRNRV